LGAVWRTNDVRWLGALMAIHPAFRERQLSRAGHSGFFT
jgi:hypothetical protein